MSREKEEWRPVVGYEGLYEVSDWGNVRSLERIITDKNGRKMHYYGKLLSQGKTTNGYNFVLLGQKNNKLTHILVAKAFLPNPDNKPEVDHIIPVSDGGTCEVWNLRWVTPSENARNPISMEKRHRKHTEESKKKMSEAKKGRKFSEEHKKKLSEAKKGKKKTTGGYKWKYA